MLPLTRDLAYRSPLSEELVDELVTPAPKRVRITTFDFAVDEAVNRSGTPMLELEANRDPEGDHYGDLVLAQGQRTASYTVRAFLCTPAARAPTHPRKICGDSLTPERQAGWGAARLTCGT